MCNFAAPFFTLLPLEANPESLLFIPNGELRLVRSLLLHSTIGSLILQINMRHRQIYRISFRMAQRFSSIHSEARNTDEVFVIENIQQMKFNDRIIQPQFMTLCLCKQGCADFVLNGVAHHMEEGDLLLLFVDCILEKVQCSSDLVATVLVQEMEFVQETLMSMLRLWPFLIHLMRQPILHLTAEAQERVRLNYELLSLRLRQPQHTFRREALVASLQAAYFDVCDLLRRQGIGVQPTSVRAFSIFEQFIRILSKEYVKHRDVSWYANELTITSKYLSDAVKMVSGRTASSWINVFVMTEIKSMLRNTDLNIKEIAEELHFPNQSLLGKYFRKYAAMTPSEYRKV